MAGVVFALWSLQGCRQDPKAPVDTAPVVFTKEGDLQVLKAASDSVLVTLDIELALTAYEIQTGLMYRKEMGKKEGMLFVFEEEGPHSFYMKNTLIPLDILFIDKDLRIVNIHRNAPPLNESGIPSGGPVQYVLEINAGLSDLWGLGIGDHIRYEKKP
jgi:uncharacterized membrane protein (UPF0127 family)